MINRLRHVALLAESNEARIPQPLRQLSLAAARRLAGLVKSRTWDTQLYMRITTLIDALINAPQNLAGGDAMDIEPAVPVAEKASGQSGEENGVPDFEWIEEAQEAERKENARLDVELRGYMSNLIKESIRVSASLPTPLSCDPKDDWDRKLTRIQLTYLAFASLSVKSGSHVNAMKNYSAAREYSTVPQHHLDLGLGVLDVSHSTSSFLFTVLIPPIDLPCVQSAYVASGPHFQTRSRPGSHIPTQLRERLQP